CDFAARAAARLAGDEVPSFPDTEATLGQLQDRISATCAYLASFGPDRFEGAAERSITLKLRSGEKVFQGLEFLTLFALPQVYFHATTAYDILRHNGVEIGKLDFMGA
ncbi:MAG: DUF1993 domain-containing protein, partial [Paracoccaceae bacterium]|nr:DUF1993 domain-containing protein [Paracoccaceae bacterium]